MSVVFNAMWTAACGDPVFQIEHGTKNRFPKPNWKNGAATCVPTEVLALLSRGAYNYGVRTDRLLVVDVDTHRGGLESVAALGELPRTRKVLTPSGGYHLYYRLPEGAQLSGGVDKLGKGVDAKTGPGSYVLGPGSSFNGKPYVLEDDLPVANCPPELVQRLSVTQRKSADAGKIVGELDTPSAIERATDYLLSSAPLAVEGSGGDATTYKVACRVLDFGVSPETTLELMRDHWNDRCSPEWDDDELEAKIGNAVQYRQAEIGRDNPATGFEPIQLFTEAPLDSLLEYASEVSLEDILADSAKDIVKRLLGPGECGTTYGESGVGKSHVMLDLAYHVALGLDYQERKTRKVPVLYVLLEGVRGFRKRIYAMTKEYGDPGAYFARLKIAVSLAKNEEGKKGADLIMKLVERMKAATGADSALVVIDTKARAVAGDNENDASDMASFSQHRSGAISRTTGAFVMTVHHPNKAGDIRGSTAVKAADDIVLHVQKGRVTAEKVKDGVEGPLFDFTLQQVQLGVDADGIPETTCVVRKSSVVRVEREVPAGAKESKPAQIYRAAYCAVSARSAKARFTHPKTGEVLDAVLSSEVAEEFLARYPSDNSDTRKRKLREAQRGLPSGLETYTIGGEQVIWLSQEW